jgi:hypothetical protein
MPELANSYDHSYERLDAGIYGSCLDSGVDTADFQHQLYADPQTLLSAPTPCAIPPVLPPPAPLADLVLSELRTAGPGGPRDEFAEIFNPTGVPISLNGYELWVDGFNRKTFGIADGAVAAGGHYLIADASFYTGSVLQDLDLQTNMGKWALVELRNGAVVDAVSFDSVFPLEGQTLPPMETASAPEESWERRFSGCQDTGVNADDFWHNLSSSNPQSRIAGSPDTPC